jgi:intein/homing endonuclease
VRIFGFEIKRAEDEVDNQPTSFAEPVNDDGALSVGSALGGSYGTILDLEGQAKSEAELVTRYRQMTLNPEIQQAVDEVVNEAISISSHDKVVEVVLDEVDLPDRVKKRVSEEFDQVLRLLDFSNSAYEIFSKFYVDGRINYHVIIDEKQIKDGIKEVRYLDPRKIRLIREMEMVPLNGQYGTSAATKKIKKEYYMYSENGFGASRSSGDYSSIAGLRIAKDSIVRVTSGLLNETNSVVLSHLHKAIKPLNQLRMLEDANVIYTLVRSPERRVFYIDVGNLPKAKAEQYLHDMMARHKNKVVYDPSTGEIRDDRKMMCYDLSTKIPLLDGRTLELKEIISEYEAGKQNWVYSCDPLTGKFYPGPVSWAGITKRDSTVVRVTFDNGKSVVCTPDHKFPVWNKGFVEAQHLTTEDSIIPGYRRQAEITPGGAKYEQIYKNETQTWEFTHREISKWKQEVGLEENISSEEYSRLIENSRITTKKSGKTWKVTTPSKEIEIIENLSSYCRERGLNRSNIKGSSGSKGYRAEILRNHKIVSVDFLEDKMDVGSMTIDRNETYHSHHTYLLDAGVYTKNTMTEDYWFPRREGNRTTEIETLPSAGSLGDNDQLTYFQNKLFKSLNVPIGRLQPENMYSFGRTSEVTREELKFGKFVKRLRNRFSILFDRLLERQLILKGVITPDEWKGIQDRIRYDFMKDNFFEELKEAEILKEKMSTLREVEEHVGKYFSRQWVRKQVLFMNDEDIEQMKKEIDEERASGEYDDGMGDMPQPEEPPEDEEMSPEDGGDEEIADESFINRTQVSKSTQNSVLPRKAQK